ncbi:unnamed protein product [Penicillium olsonii]|nr:unnamed protein product [Penicillium olsonii]CAG7921345.1 unnamed protein product [Penicillium olsonii]
MVCYTKRSHCPPFNSSLNSIHQHHHTTNCSFFFNTVGLHVDALYQRPLIPLNYLPPCTFTTFSPSLQILVSSTFLPFHQFLFTMPHKVNNSNSTLASQSSGDQTTEVRNLTNPVRKPPVIVHNKGGQIYDETRPSDWDKQRWK